MIYEEAVKDTEILNIANNIVRRYQKLLCPEDLEQCKQIGIWQGCTKYQPERSNKCKLSTYIAHYIRWECGKLIDSNKRYKLQHSNNLEQLVDRSKTLFEYETFSDLDEYGLLVKRFEHKFTLKEIASETGMSVSQVRRQLDRIISELRQDLS